MLIHVTPRLYVPDHIQAPVRLVDLTIHETGLVLNGDQDITIRRPYPNKRYWVGCRKVGQKAISGILINSETFLNSYTVTTRWAVNADIVLSHHVEHIVIDSEFDTVSDSMMLWYATSQSLGNWSSRWPDCYKECTPTKVQPRMDLLIHDLGGSLHQINTQDTLSQSGVVICRKQQFMVPTIERERFSSKFAEMDRLPSIEYAFCSQSG